MAVEPMVTHAAGSVSRRQYVDKEVRKYARPRVYHEIPWLEEVSVSWHFATGIDIHMRGHKQKLVCTLPLLQRRIVSRHWHLGRIRGLIAGPEDRDARYKVWLGGDRLYGSL